MNHKLNQEICKLYQQGSRDLHPTERQHFRWSLVSLLQKPNGMKRHWLKNVTAARRRQARRLARNNEIDVTTPEQSLLLRWMQSNRPR
jgi:ADP-heptose:LPS heptosyltransferase